MVHHVDFTNKLKALLCPSTASRVDTRDALMLLFVCTLAEQQLQCFVCIYRVCIQQHYVLCVSTVYIDSCCICPVRQM